MMQISRRKIRPESTHRLQLEPKPLSDKKTPLEVAHNDWPWRRKRQSPFASYQLHLQATPTAVYGFHMALRATFRPNRGEDQGMTVRNRLNVQVLICRYQGFDEFMNLVIDDAVEVKLASKTEEEKRRSLGG
jgi:hypothetical protein